MTNDRALSPIPTPLPLFERHPSAGSFATAGRYALVATFAAAAAFGFALHAQPPVADGAMFEIGGRIIARGGTLYRDVWDTKLPGVYLINAAMQILFGERYRAHAAFETIVACVAALLVGAVARGFGKPYGLRAATLAATMLCIATAQKNQTEMYGLVGVLGAIVCVQRDRALVAGLLLGVATFVWIPSLLMLGVLGLLAPSRLKTVLVAVSFTLVVECVVLVCALGPLEARTLVASWYGYVAAVPVARETTNLVWGEYARRGLVRSGILIPFVLTLARIVDSRVRRILVVWLATTFATTIVGFRFYDHYFIPIIAPLALALVLSRPAGAWWWNRLTVPAIALAVAIPTARDIKWNQIGWHARAARSAKIAHMVRNALGPTMTIGTDFYAPEIYLALDPVLRSAEEIVAPSNRNAPRHPLQQRPLDVAILIGVTSRAPVGRTLVCERQTRPWRMYVRPELVRRFAVCEPTS